MAPTVNARRSAEDTAMESDCNLDLTRHQRRRSMLTLPPAPPSMLLRFASGNHARGNVSLLYRSPRADEPRPLESSSSRVVGGGKVYKYVKQILTRRQDKKTYDGRKQKMADRRKIVGEDCTLFHFVF